MRIKIIFLIVLFGGLLPGCKKVLDIKPDKSMVIPSSLEDFQAILDNNLIMNLVHPGACEVSADNYYVPEENYNSISTLTAKNLYIWENDVFNDIKDNDWNLAYRTVYYSNVVLDGLKKINNPGPEFNDIKGAALFFRALSFFEVAQIFAKPYKMDSNINDLGISLRLQSDISEVSVRASLGATYKQIIADLKMASEILSDFPSSGYKTRPSKPAAYALLARVYLAIQDYDNALLYSTKALQLFNHLLDYNTDIDVNNPTSPILRYNDETIFFSQAYNWGIITFSKMRVDTALYSEYDENDIRKNAFFRQVNDGHIFKGTYTGSRSQLIFTGLATDELYLTRAECYAREGNIPEAMRDLNTLMIKRWKNNGSFISFTASGISEALQIILKERRKELIFRGLRWTDIRRLNMDSDFSIELKRNIHGKIFFLHPNDNKYTLPIPADVINATGMPQN